MLLRGSIETKDAQGRTALRLAAYSDHPETVTELSRLGANLNGLADDSYSGTVLHWAVYFHKRDLIEMLLGLGADINGQDSYQRSPLFIACRAGYNDIIDFLIANNADVNLKDRVGQTPLFEVVAMGKLEAIRRFLGACTIDVNSEDNDKKYAVQLAAERRNYEVVKLLVSRSTVVDRPTQELIDPEERIRQSKEDLD